MNHAATELAETAPDPDCAFCGRPQREVFLLVAGPRAMICDRCIGTALTTLVEHVHTRIASREIR